MKKFNRALAIFVFSSAAAFFTPRVALAASASITAAPQADGSVPATITGSFGSCTVCDARDAAGNCTQSHTINNGSVSLSRDGGFPFCSASGNGSASCTKVEDRAGLHGTHFYNGTASDCTGSASSTFTLTLDNTPTVTVTNPIGVISGPFDITGTATFKPTLATVKGTITLYLNNNSAPTNVKNCTTENCTYSYQEIAGKLLDFTHGPYTVKLVAAGGGASASDQKTFTVDKMPTIAVTNPIGVISGPFDITGTATFKPTLNATKGTITLYLNNNSAPTNLKNCTTENCAYSYQEIAGRLLDFTHGGPYTVKLVAAGGGASASDEKTFTVDKMPAIAVTNPIGVISGPFDITGTATFKPALSASKGLIQLYLNGSFVLQKDCPTESCPFSYKEITGRFFEMSHGGPHTVRLLANGGGATAVDQQTFTVDNMPTVAVTAPAGTVQSPFNVTGNATFKPTLSSTKGAITGFINGNFIAQKSCLTESCSFSYQELTGRLFTLATGGPYTVRLVATGGGATASDQKTFNVATCRDNDNDGFFGYDPVSCPQGNDCNDNDAAINPEAKERCNKVDDNCNGYIDEGPCSSCEMNQPFGSLLNLASGNLGHSQDLFSTRGTGLTTNISLHYNSLDLHDGPLGIGWTHSYNMGLVEMSNGSVVFREGNGRTRLYQLSGGVYVSHPGDYSALTKEVDGWKLVEKSGTTYAFNSEGKITSISDRNSNAMTFLYTAGLLTSVVDSSGKITTVDYDPQQRLSAITEPNGNGHSFTYANGTLTSVSTQDSQLGARTWSYTYDADAFLLTKTDPNGDTTTYGYDTDHRGVATTTPEGKVKTASYDPASSTARITESDGGIWTYTYDEILAVLIQKSDPQGNITSYAYDANRNLASRTDPDGSTTSYTYDSQGNMTSMTDALGQTTGYTYNSFGQVTGTTGPQGDVTVQTYDAKGNLISTTDPSGAVTSYEYDAKGNITRLTDAQGRVTTFAYDAQGNLASITDPAGATTTFTYDVSGNRTSQTDALGNVTTFEYDSLGQLIKTTDPSGNVTAYSYDGNGNRVAQTDANGNIAEYEYNSKGQLTAVEDALGSLTSYAYDGASCPGCSGGGGNSLTEVTDANGRVTHYRYDASGRLVEEADPLGNILSYTYDAKGNLIAKTDANGATTQYAYDAVARLIQKTYADNSIETFTYDAKGNILTAANQHIAYTFGYDINSRVTAVTDSNGRTISYQYDALGNRTRATYPDGSVVSYGYDTAGRLASLTHAGRTFGFQYDNLGRRTGLTFPNGAVATYAYDNSARLAALTHTASTGSTIQSFAYTHDNVGNRKTKVDRNGAFSYTYDTLYRLTEATNPLPSNPVETYTYDAVGNRTNSNQNGLSSFNVANQLTEDTKFTYQYDSNGNLTRKSAKSGAKVTLYAYNFENWLIRVEIQKADKIKIVTFAYDPFGRRLSKTVLKQEIEDEDDEEGEPDEDEVEVPRSIFYVYDNEDIVLEYNHKGKLKARYTHGPGIDEPLAVEQKKEVYFYHADGLGSVVALTDTKQKVVETYDYDSFGNFKRKGGKAKNAYAFTGREWNREIGLYYYRARYYDAATGRFLAFDPILRGVRHTESNSCRQAVNAFPLKSPPALNQYVYVGDNPLLFTDPHGLAGATGSWGGGASGTWDTAGNGNIWGGYIPQDWICTDPAGSLNQWSCTKRCCVIHDACYQQFGCNASSWIRNFLPPSMAKVCQLCNAIAVRCMTESWGKNDCCP